MTENFPFLFQYLEKEKINIDKNEFAYQVQSHADYPSLLAISDTLSFFKISNLATRLETENIVHLPDDFIALIKKEEAVPAFAFVERTKNGFQYSEGGKSVSVANDAFHQMFQNVVLLAEKEEDETAASNSGKILSYGSVLLGVIYLASVFITGFSWLTLLFICFAAVGVYLSVEAISHEFGVKTKFSEAVCTMTTNSDCDAVINSKKPGILALFSFSDASIAFFSAQLLGLLLFSISKQLESFYNFSTILLLLSLPITLFSLYQQKVVAKKWCPICIAITGLIYLELISLLVLNNGLNLAGNIQAVCYFSIVLMGSYLAAVFIKKTIRQNRDLQSDIMKNNRFKRNYNLFKMALLASDKVKSKAVTKESILLGNPEARLKIRIVSSPFCGHCKEAHQIIEEILVRYRDVVCFDMHFNYNDSRNDDKSKEIHYKLMQIYFNEGQDAFMEALHNWFENRDETKLASNSILQMSDLKINEILHGQFSWNQENKITYTPAIIINDYLFPKEYDRNELLYFISNLEDDADFN